jgi:hypothetical protein
MTKHIKNQSRKSKSRKPQTGGTHHLPEGNTNTTTNMIVYLILGVLLSVVIGIVAYLILQTEKNNAVTMSDPIDPIPGKPINNTTVKLPKEKMTNLSLTHPELSGYRDVGPDADNPRQISYWDYLNMKDHERIINPLLPPERSYENTYGIPINIPSRGFSGGFQQIGTLYKNQIADDGKVIGNSSDTVIIPIFGRPVYPGANKWNYYVTSDKYAMVKMPFTFKGKKTDDQYGVDELFDGDVITLPEYNGEFVVKIYQYDKPRYIPFIY